MQEAFLEEASYEATIGVKNKDGGPFGAIIVDDDDNIISRGHNMVLSTNDPTNHAEIVAIREACKKLGTHDLSGYTIYSSCEPCPMCLSAIAWSNLDKIVYGATRKDAEKAGFRDDALYEYFKGENSIINKQELISRDCIRVLDEYEGEVY